MLKEYPNRPKLAVSEIKTSNSDQLFILTGQVYDYPGAKIGEEITINNAIGITKYGEVRTSDGDEFQIINEDKEKNYIFGKIETILELKLERPDPRLSETNKEKYLTTQERSELPERPTEESKRSQIQLIESRRTRERLSEDVTYEKGKEVENND